MSVADTEVSVLDVAASVDLIVERVCVISGLLVPEMMVAVDSLVATVITLAVEPN